MEIDEYIKRGKELQAEMAKQGQTLLLEMFKKMFEDVPELASMRWRQYTPYFNDGDPCVFRVGDVYFRLKDDSSNVHGDNSDYGDGYGDAYSLLRINPALGERLPRVQQAFYDATRAMQPWFLAAFGDHAKVTLSSDLTVESVEHRHD